MAKKTKSFAGVVKPIEAATSAGIEQEIATSSTPTEGDQTAAYAPAPGTLQLSKQATETYEIVIFDEDQRKRRDDYDRRITTGLETFIDVATALIGLQEEKLYKETHSTFEAYCEEKYGLGRRRAYQLMEAGKTVLSLTTDDNEPLEMAPTLPAHATALADVEEEHRREVWDAVVSDSKETGKKITAKAIEKTNERLTGKAPKVKAGKSPKKKGAVSGADDEFSDEQAAITSSALTRGLGDYKPAIAHVGDADDEEPTDEEHTEPEADDTDGAALSLSSFSRSDDQEPGSDETYNVDTDDEAADEQAEQITAVRDAIRQSVGGEVTLLVKGSFLKRNGLSIIWASLRQVNDADLIDEHFEDTISLEEARSLGII